MPTNAKAPGKWPEYAADCRDEAKFLSERINETAKAAQMAFIAGQSGEAIVLCGDIRDLANRIIWQMVQAESGCYAESAAIQDANAKRRERDDRLVPLVPDRGISLNGNRAGSSPR